MTAHTNNQARESVVAGEAGYGLGLAGFISSFVASPVGLVLSIVGLRQSRAIGKKNSFALAGIIIGAVGIVVGLIVMALTIFGTIALINYCTANQTNCEDSNSGGSSRMDLPPSASDTRRTF